MKVFLKKLKRFLISIFILNLIIILSNFIAFSTAMTYQVPQIQNSISYEKINLGISDEITIIEATFQSNLTFNQIWDILILNLSIRNFGDSLDSITVKVTANGVKYEKSFLSFEQIGLSKALAHQFEIPQSLYMSLDYLEQNSLSIELHILLDSTISWRSPNINLSITNAEIIGLNALKPINYSQIPFYSAKYSYIIQPKDYSILQKKLIINGIAIINIPKEKQLDGTIRIILKGGEFDYISINGKKTFTEDYNKNDLNDTLLLKNSTNNMIPIKILVTPEYLEEEGSIKIELFVFLSGILISIPDTSFGNIIGFKHPIPSWIMFPLLIFGLFIIPYYFVYQEQVIKKDKEFFDPKNQKKL